MANKDINTEPTAAKADIQKTDQLFMSDGGAALKKAAISDIEKVINGETSLSGIGDGTVTGAISALNSKTSWALYQKVVSNGQTLQVIASFTVPANVNAVVTLSQDWASGKPMGCGISDNSETFIEVGTSASSPSRSTYLVGSNADTTYYIWAKISTDEGTIRIQASTIVL